MTQTKRRDAIAIIVMMVLVVGIASAAFVVLRGSGGYTPGVLVKPGPFHGVHGLAFGPDGTLYAGDIIGMTVHGVDVKTGAAHPVIPAPDGMADDVAIAPLNTPFAGTLVWTGVGVGRVYARAPSGAVRLIAENLPSVNSVGFSPDGRLFVTQIGPGTNVLWELDLNDPAHGGKPPQKIWDDTGGLNGFVITKDNLLYGPQGEKGRVIRFDLTSREVKVIADGFQWPTGVKMDSKGKLYVCDLEAGTVSRLDKDTGAKQLLATLEPGLDNLIVGPDDKIYVSSISRNGIFQVDPQNGAVRDVTRGQLTAPGGIASTGIGPTAKLYIADLYTLREVDPKSGAVRTILSMGQSSLYPTNVTVRRTADGAVRLIVTSWFTGRLQIIEPVTGKVLREEKDLAGAHDAVEWDDGTLLVAESRGHKLTRISPEGLRTTLPATFAEPVGIALAGHDTAYVTDAWSGTLSRLDLKSGRATVLAKDFVRPEGLAVRADSRILVVDSAARVLFSVDPVTGEKEKAATELAVGLVAPPPQNAAWVHNGVAIDADGVVYLPSDTQAAVYTLTPRR